MSATLIALEGDLLTDAVARAPGILELLRAGVDDGRLAAIVLGADTAPRAYDPVALATALTVHVPGIAVIAGSDGISDHPYNSARRLLSLDHVSGGRGGALFSSGGASASHTAERITVIRKLWNSWPADTVLADHATGRYATTDGIRAIGHVGDHFRVGGALNSPSSRQGEPVSLWHIRDEDELEAARDLVDLVVTDNPALAASWDASGRAGRVGGARTGGDAVLLHVATVRGLADALAAASPAAHGGSLRDRLGLPQRHYDLSHAPLAFGATHA